ncbi:hypothetical protein IW140_000703 [Coemansia sp. RSA 1813]|nr:hypothetical protein EV178_000792 [Coemansia sp. RSA 1646]KAJ1773571.1 hypothetical protein LPJ74_000487 [Coemansia sp. RSA 1843]KAJ2092412.1 hypothetical protein IW138_001174 [Coemansia sp. RSA 986]KAJ2217363.1 hypothetical protein EV179_000513 [Coemansia sp. RSA 487]KAJ2572588.1 hypothetical protein IW140_000703 [Coemansia sp. RSA 1813]
MVSPSTNNSDSQNRGHLSPAAAYSGRVNERAVFDDRIHAGQQLATGLQEYVGSPDTVVLSLSRGGAIVASVVAEQLGPNVPHFYYMVRPIPCATIPRLSLGSVAGDGSVRIDNMVAKSMGIVCDTADEATGSGTSHATAALMQAVENIDVRLQVEQGSFWRAPPCANDLEGKTLLVVDDGMEAGDTVREAILHLRHCYRPHRIVVVVPVCLADLRWQLRRHNVCVVDIVSPLFVGSIARWYVRGVAASEAEQAMLTRLFVGPAASAGEFDYE